MRRMRIKEKFNKSAGGRHPGGGFTLSEMLVTVLILSLVTAAGVRAIAGAQRTYGDVVDASNAQLLLTTATTELKNELSTASDIAVTDGEISYVSSYTGNMTRIYIEDGEILVEEFIIGGAAADEDEEAGDEDETITRRLVSSEASTEGLSVTYGEVSYKDGIVKFENITVKRGESTLASCEEYLIRPLIS